MNKQWAYDLAAAFSVELEQTLTYDQFEEVLHRNAAETDPRICHSHDFCDANQVMLDALSAIGAELGWPEHIWKEFDASNDEQGALINKAWGIAKEAKFNIK